jgi:hypothetical protein
LRQAARQRSSQKWQIVSCGLVLKMQRTAPRKHKFSDRYIRKLQPLPPRAYAVWDLRQPKPGRCTLRCTCLLLTQSGHRLPLQISLYKPV